MFLILYMLIDTTICRSAFRQDISSDWSESILMAFKVKYMYVWSLPGVREWQCVECVLAKINKLIEQKQIAITPQTQCFSAVCRKCRCLAEFYWSSFVFSLCVQVHRSFNIFDYVRRSTKASVVDKHFSVHCSKQLWDLLPYGSAQNAISSASSNVNGIPMSSPPSALSLEKCVRHLCNAVLICGASKFFI